nr:Chain E, Single-stranded DNA-binding protein [Escherichia coli]3Q8D_F Chain F, Single-stranded DNA-binding protein [Escherichia coli]
YMDFDDDIPF